MPPIMLGLQNTSLAALQVLKYYYLTPEPLENSNALPSTAQEHGNLGTGDGTALRHHDFRVVRFRNSYYACSNQGVFKKQLDGSWSNAAIDGGLPFVSPSDDNPYPDSVIRGGLFLATVNDKPRLFGWYKVDESVQPYHHRGFYLDPDTSNWVLGAVTNVGSSGLVTYRGYGNTSAWSGLYYQFFDGKLLHILGNAQSNKSFGLQGVHKTYNPSTDTWASITNPSGGNTDGSGWNRSFCVWQGRVFAIYYGSTAGINYRASLWEFIDGLWTEVLQIAVSTYDGSRSVVGRNPLWTDGTNLYFMMRFQTVTDGWRCYQITPSLVASEITTAVVPAGLRNGQPSTAGLLPIVDSISSPGQTTIYLRYWNNHSYGNPMTLYKWNGASTQLSVLDTGGDASHALPHGVLSGLYLYSNGTEVIIEEMTDITIGKTLHFKVYGGGTGKTVKFYFGDILGTQATLAGTATGGTAVRNGNQVENVLADGTTIYTVDFNAISHGLYDGDSVRLVGIAS